MRNLKILKAIVDWVWIITIILGPIVLLIGVISLFKGDFGSMFLIDDLIGDTNNTMIKVVFSVVYMSLYGVSIYAFYLFRKLITLFLRDTPFHVQVSLLFKKIGILLIVVSLVELIADFTKRIVLDSRVAFEFGFNTTIVVLCLGLFCSVLSQFFTIARIHKEENELTV